MSNVSLQTSIDRIRMTADFHQREVDRQMDEVLARTEARIHAATTRSRIEFDALQQKADEEFNRKLTSLKNQQFKRKYGIVFRTFLDMLTALIAFTAAKNFLSAPQTLSK